MICQGRRFLEIVGHVQCRDIRLSPNILQQFTDLQPRIAVERRQRLVQTKDIGPKRKGASQGHSLRLAATQPFRSPLEEMRDLQQLSQFFNSIQDFAARDRG